MKLITSSTIVTVLNIHLVKCMDHDHVRKLSKHESHDTSAYISTKDIMIHKQSLCNHNKRQKHVL